ncbi:MAG: GNAT family N-acetyltransferase [Bacteroidota bacterium]
MPDKNILKDLTIEPLSKDNWDKFVQLFGTKGACGNCWCMYYRLPKKEFVEGKQNNGNKQKMKKLVWNYKPAGVIGFYKEQPIAWCAFAPRDVYLKIENSRVHKRIDDKPVWSIPCFFIEKEFRRKGISVAMLQSIIQYAKENKIGIIEAYPAIPTKSVLPDSFAWTGLYKSFERAGFEIADHTSKNRPMVRYYTNKK